MMDHAVATIDDAFGEAKHILQPADHWLGIPATQRRIDARRFDFARLGHADTPSLTASLRPICAKCGVIRLKICYPSASTSFGRVNRLSISARRRAQAVGGSPANSANSRTRWA